MPELKLDGVRFRVYRGDTLRAFGEAASATLRRDSTELTAKDLVANLPSTPAPVRITAPSGEGVIGERRFFASGGVVVSRGADVARTERARFEPSPDPGSGSGAGLVLGDDPVVVEGRGYRLEGAGFVLDPEKGDISVRGGARLLAGATR